MAPTRRIAGLSLTAPSGRRGHAAPVLGIALLLLIVTPISLPGHSHAAANSAVPERASVAPGMARAGTSLGSIFMAITNNGSSPTGTFEQKVIIDSASYSSLINSNWSNGAAAYASNGTPIYLWIESGASNLSSHTVLWLRLYSIPSNGQALVALTFQAKSAFLFSAEGFSGENPLLSATYAEFDNGAKVFDFYDNFSGTTLSGLWTTSGSWSYTVNNGIAITGIPGSGGYISSTASFAFPETVDFYGDLYQSISATHFDTEGIGTSGCTGCGTGASVGFDSGGGGVLAGPSPWVGVGSNGWWGSPVLTSQTYATFTTVAVSGTEAQFLLNDSNPSTEVITLPSSPEPVGLAMSGAPTGAPTNTETTYWIRERATANTSVGGPQVFGATPTSLVALPGTLSVGQSLTLLATAISSPPVTYSYSGLPSGCASIDQPTLSCVVLVPGQFAPSVTISDQVGDSLRAVTNLTVTSPGTSTPPPPLAVQLAAVPSTVLANESLTIIASVSGGTAPASFAYSGLPPGCASADQFYVSCAPSSAGAYTVTVTVTDGASQSAGASVGVTVTLPTITPPPPFTASLTSFDGTLWAGSPLLVVTSVSGGEGPYTYAYSGLPGGCGSANSSSLTCTPTATGPFDIMVTVTDAHRATATASASLTLAAAPAATSSSTSGLSTDQGYELGAGIALGLVIAVVALARTFGGGRQGGASPPPRS